ncbi:MAG: uroporphyrinogen-III synthase [Candidatus Odinarchaeota archaeon]
MDFRKKTIAITRPIEQAEELADLIRDHNGIPIITTTLELHPFLNKNKIIKIVKKILNILDQTDYLIFLSQNGVKFFFKYLESSNLTEQFLSKLIKIQILAIGKKTQQELDNFNIKDVLIPKVFSSEGIIELLKSNDLKNKKLVILCSNKYKNIIKKNLSKYKVKIKKNTIYKVLSPKSSDYFKNFVNNLKAKNIDIIIFTSVSSVRNFIKLSRNFIALKKIRILLNEIIIVAIGNTTKKYLEEYGFLVRIAPAIFTIENMLDEISFYLSKQN